MKTVLSLLTACLLSSAANAALDTAALERAMANPDRPAADKERDVNRKAPELLAFMGLQSGMTALDLIAIGGWYTEVLSYAVGDSGKVYMQNSESPFVERNMPIINDRLARLSNVEHWMSPVSDIPAGSVDFVMTALNFHDVYNPDPAAAQGFLGQIANVMKTGGILAVVDHEGSAGADNETLHRIAFDDAVMALVASGDFALLSTSDMLNNPADDHTKGPFDESLARNTDRFALKLIKM
ncbi:MAG: putative methyltransferase [Glaciecola sp.]|jgi:predicted methyltransferase